MKVRKGKCDVFGRSKSQFLLIKRLDEKIFKGKQDENMGSLHPCRIQHAVFRTKMGLFCSCMISVLIANIAARNTFLSHVNTYLKQPDSQEITKKS